MNSNANIEYSIFNLRASNGYFNLPNAYYMLSNDYLSLSNHYLSSSNDYLSPCNGYLMSSKGYLTFMNDIKPTQRSVAIQPSDRLLLRQLADRNDL